MNIIERINREILDIQKEIVMLEREIAKKQKMKQTIEEVSKKLNDVRK